MYEEIFIYHSDEFTDKIVYALPGASVGQKYPEKDNSGKYKSVTYGIPVGSKIQFTGSFFETSSGDTCFQITVFNFFGNKILGFVWMSDLKNFSETSFDTVLFSKGVSAVTEMIENNKAILENNLLCARGLQIMTENGAAMPTAFRTNLYNLQARLINRNIKLKQSGYVSDVQEATSPNFSIYNQGLVDFMNNPGIGFVISTTAAIIITCVIIAATAAAAWTLFKTMHAESKSDFQLSSELTADLIKYLPPEVYQQLVKENAANAAKAQDAIDKASGKQWINIIKYGAIGYGVIWAWEKLQQNSIKNYGNAKLN